MWKRIACWEESAQETHAVPSQSFLSFQYSHRRSERDCWCSKPRSQCSTLFWRVFWSTTQSDTGHSSLVSVSLDFSRETVYQSCFHGLRLRLFCGWAHPAQAFFLLAVSADACWCCKVQLPAGEGTLQLWQGQQAAQTFRSNPWVISVLTRSVLHFLIPFRFFKKKKIFPETSLSICKTYQSEKL